MRPTKLITSMLLIPLALAGAALCQTPPAAAKPDAPLKEVELPEGCVGIIFGHFCLGGSVSLLPPEGQVDEELGSVSWPRSPTEMDVVMTYDDRIDAVVRRSEPGTWATFERQLTSLVKSYGEGQDQSVLPAEADTPEKIEEVIAQGAGRVRVVWDRGLYEVRIVWVDAGGVQLGYVHKDLESRKHPRGE
jgi:hypothetical protein